MKNDIFHMEISRHCFIIFENGGRRQVSCEGEITTTCVVQRVTKCTSSLYSSSSWWSGWVNAARETSLAALSATKRDLAEFVTVLKSDTEAVMTGATTSLRTLLVRRCSALCRVNITLFSCDSLDSE